MKTMFKSRLLLSVVLLFIATLATAQVEFPENATTHIVKGRNGWMMNQTLSFGPYESGKVKRSWTSAPSFEFVVRLAKAKEKFRFELADDQGNSSEVFMSGELKRKELPIFDGSMSLMLPDEDIFAGVIFVNQVQEPWEFYLENPNKQTVMEKVNGQISNGQETIQIEESRYISGGKKPYIGGQALAFKFVQDGKVLGVVEVINKGKVILDESLSTEQKFVLANAASAILLQQNLMDTVENN
ncbi:MAG: hypothetical protein SFU99_10585 [Saprospiraceae bacterium]|nr:hypothetical protein [Saprospiraceae bacterium]